MPKTSVGWGHGRFLPQTATERMAAARRHREHAYSERNELLVIISRLWPAHIMPTTANLKNLENVVLCIHSPAGHLAYVITRQEADEQFSELPREQRSHFDGCTRAERTLRLLTCLETLR